MGKRNKSQYKHSLMKYYRDMDHMPLKKKSDMKGTLADQIREKVLGEIFENLDVTSEYAVDMCSKTFDNKKIRLKHIMIKGYTAADVRGFFFALDFVDTVYVVVDDKQKPFVTPDSLFVIKLGNQKHILPVQLFWSALPSEIREQFKGRGSFFILYKAMFSAYNRKLFPTETP